MNAKELAAVTTSSPKPTLAPWDSHLTEYQVHPDATVVGKTLEQLKMRETTGTIIALVERGSQRIVAPTKDFLLMPYDKLFVIGTEEQLTRLRAHIELDSRAIPLGTTISYGLQQVVLEDESQFIGKSIRLSGVRELTQGLIVGLERDGVRTLNPDSGLLLKAQDLLWIVGDLTKIKSLREAGPERLL